jgi:outer membrane immunogenic protein
MRRILIALLSATAVGAVSANAADLPLKASPAPVVTVYNWTGCYVGAHLGGGWANTSWSNTANTTAFGDMTAGQNLSADNGGFIGGGQLGCNYQMQNFVFGIEGTFAGSTIKGDTNNTSFGAADDVFTNQVTAIATVVGRLGYAWDNWLVYAKGGYAGGEVKFSVSDSVGITGAGSDSSWQSGWTLGGGVEYGFTPNWIFGLEYSYIDLGTTNYQVSGSAATSYAFDVKTNIHEVVARVSYRFWP